MDIGGQVVAVPEPGTIGLSLASALGLTLTFLRRKRLAT